jgi:hypothetical protein
MIPALKRIWTACFGDEGGYTDYIFGRLLTPEQILVASEGGEPVSMACMNPFTLGAQCGDAEGVYLYGVATPPEQQSKGHSTMLLAECHRILAAQNKALSVLVPASESLFGFYGARGYKPFTSIQKATYRKGQLASPRGCVISPLDRDKIAAMRDKAYANRACIRWGERYLRYIVDECRMLGGDALALSFGDESGYAICYPSGDRIVVKELAVADHLLPDAAAAILDHFAREECLVYLPPDAEALTSNKVLPFAMVRWYDREKQKRMKGGSPYIAHVLDD